MRTGPVIVSLPEFSYDATDSKVSDSDYLSRHIFLRVHARAVWPLRRLHSGGQGARILPEDARQEEVEIDVM